MEKDEGRGRGEGTWAGKAEMVAGSSEKVESGMGERKGVTGRQLRSMGYGQRRSWGNQEG